MTAGTVDLRLLKLVYNFSRFPGTLNDVFMYIKSCTQFIQRQVSSDVFSNYMLGYFLIIQQIRKEKNYLNFALAEIILR